MVTDEKLLATAEGHIHRVHIEILVVSSLIQGITDGGQLMTWQFLGAFFVRLASRPDKRDCITLASYVSQSPLELMD